MLGEKLKGGIGEKGKEICIGVGAQFGLGGMPLQPPSPTPMGICFEL